jgi:hypothetical protein
MPKAPVSERKQMSDTSENEHDPECTCEAPTFEQELVGLINKHSMERYSGTPDWILANFLAMVLRQFDCAVQMRANWRGESTELPALQTLLDGGVYSEKAAIAQELMEQGLAEVPEELLKGLREKGPIMVLPNALDGNDGKTVPLVDYSDGKRNVIGSAKIRVTPGEVLFDGSVDNIESVVPLLGLIPTRGQFSIDDSPKG